MLLENTRVAAYSSASCITNLVWVLPALGRLLENLELLNAAIGRAMRKLDPAGSKWLIV